MGLISKKKNGGPAPAGKLKLSTIIISGLIFITAGIILILVDPLFLITLHRLRISNGSVVMNILSHEHEGVHVSAYLFNVTNAERFMSGEDYKLKVEEVGPFTYIEYRTNEEIELDEEARTLGYTPRVKTVFIPEESVANPEDVNITMPNVALLSMTSVMSTYSYLTRVGYNILVRRLDTEPIVTMNAHKYLWGYDEPLIKLGNTILPGWINFDTMGVMDRLYDTKNTFRLEVSIDDSEKFLIKTLDGKKGLPKWDYNNPSKRSRCNTLEDTYEGFAYRPQLPPGSPLRLYRNALCRIVELDYLGTTSTDFGSEALEYTISNRTFMNNPDKDCLCSKSTCVDGVSDLSPCFMGLPFAISNAHLMDAEPAVFERIEGLKPDKEKHGSQFLIDSQIGIVLGTTFSTQMNIVIKDVSYNSKAKRFSNMVIPIVYYKIVQPPLPEEKKSGLKMMLVTGPRIMLAVEIILIITGLCLLAYAVRLIYFNTKVKGNGIAFQVTNENKEQALDAAQPLTGQH